MGADAGIHAALEEAKFPTRSETVGPYSKDKVDELLPRSSISTRSRAETRTSASTSSRRSHSRLAVSTAGTTLGLVLRRITENGPRSRATTGGGDRAEQYTVSSYVVQS